MVQWVVYDHPADHPDVFVARRWEIRRGRADPTATTIASPDLDIVRGSLARMGLVPLARSPEDDPKIIEVWL